jgi:TetR/AcrR family tetracycline transcriptional repressor
LVLRSYTTGFVILEQAFLGLEGAGEWESLINVIGTDGHSRIAETDDAIAIMTGDRDQRFSAGLATVLAGTVRTQ